MSQFIQSYTQVVKPISTPVQRTGTSLKEVIQYKIRSVQKLTEIRNAQRKLITYSKYADGSIAPHITDWNKYEELDKEEMPSLYKMFGYIAIDKKGNAVQTWNIETTNNIADLNQLLKKEI